MAGHCRRTSWMQSRKWPAPPSGRSSRLTLVMTRYLMFIRLAMSASRPAPSGPAAGACPWPRNRTGNCACRRCRGSARSRCPGPSTRRGSGSWRSCRSSPVPAIPPSRGCAGNYVRPARAVLSHGGSFRLAQAPLMTSVLLVPDAGCTTGRSSCSLICSMSCILPVSFWTDVIRTPSSPHGTMYPKMLRSF